ncbi:hypothetical protein [Rhodocytophaga rosea]|uniref:hypothetical protein n=1 Tax=Rhodocytophaga rosea TaxID=2704465 RepID=UPI0018D615E6|nr:hypothetical protein [Rhodocytophaga rosea]
MFIKRYFLFLIFFSYASGLMAKDYPASLFGISSDGLTLNTRSIQAAIDYIHTNGGAAWCLMSEGI